MTVEVREGSECDLPRMLALWREMMDFHAGLDPRFRPLPFPQAERQWEAYVLQDILGHNDWCIYVAESDGLLVGQIVGSVRDIPLVFEPMRYGFVSDIVVAPSARRKGVGEALFEALKAWFRERGATHIELHAAHNNPAAQAFWRAQGFSDYMDTLWSELESG